ncbi:MAG: hypothetical protein ACI38Z_05000 [Parafannyhessea sp.]|uniref:hypothetical protein n=1 Tax=Parafannyhessea sp. TaxID=2847324 RepID=UPI003F0F8F24
MEFEPIETQEDFDRAIKARLERERAKAREHYADYDELKEKAGKLEEAERKIGELEDAAAKRSAAVERRANSVPPFNVKNPRSREGQLEYDSMMSDIIDRHDSMLITHAISGQDENRCAVFVKGNDIAVINLDTRKRVTAFRYSQGVSRVYDAIWNQIGA